jgi:hypothetical protein
MEGLRQALCLMYVALAEAVGGDDTLRRANAIIRDGLDDGVIDSPEGVCILAGILDGTARELEEIRDVAAIDVPAFPDLFDQLATVH